MLFTGDQVMQGSTVVINPPDGDMAAYLASLAQLADAATGSFDVIAPGHGFLVEQPERLLRGLIAHRAVDGREVGRRGCEQLIERIDHEVAGLVAVNSVVGPAKSIFTLSPNSA